MCVDIGYGRVSTSDQDASAQADALVAAGCSRVYLDKISGAVASRPQLDLALEALREGDRLVITKLDRLGRSLSNLIELSGLLDRRGVQLIVLSQQIDTSTPAGRMFFHMIGAIAEFERELISERTREGLAAARRKGRVGGRPSALSTSQIGLVKDLYEATDDEGRRLHTVEYIAAEVGVSRATVYRSLRD